MIPVLEVGGTHVAAALVDPAGWTVARSQRHAVDANASADDLLAAFAAAARGVDAPIGEPWGVAMPDPFDYVAGIALFDAGVAKFGALHGVDVGAALRAELGADVVFVNDADAFALGEWAAGVAIDAVRLAAITLGTGVGSGWLVDGSIADPGFPPGGRIHHAQVFGAPLEETMSRRAIRSAYATAGGDPAADVRDICDSARAGDELAAQVLQHALIGLGAVIGSAVGGFGADLLVVGGSMAASWELFEPWFRADAGRLPPLRISDDADRSGFVGAAVHATRAAT